MNLLADITFTPKRITLIVYASYLVFLSIVAFIAYYSDKKKATKGKYRTKEKTLLTLSIVGGAFGGMLSMVLFHHKTSKEHWYFTFVNLLGIAIHLTTLLVLIFVVQF